MHGRASGHPASCIVFGEIDGNAAGITRQKVIKLALEIECLEPRIELAFRLEEHELRVWVRLHLAEHFQQEELHQVCLARTRYPANPVKTGIRDGGRQFLPRPCGGLPWALHRGRECPRRELLDYDFGFGGLPRFLGVGCGKALVESGELVAESDELAEKGTASCEALPSPWAGPVNCSMPSLTAFLTASARRRICGSPSASICLARARVSAAARAASLVASVRWTNRAAAAFWASVLLAFDERLLMDVV